MRTALLRLFLAGLVFGLLGCEITRLQLDSSDAPASRIRNVILIIGDGMGPQQVGLLTTYAHQAPGSPYPDGITTLERAMDEGVVGIMRTAPHACLVTDSAAAATQMATGSSSRSEMIGLDHRGDPAATILEKCEEGGMATGLVTDTRLTHATPAAFASHQAHRSQENAIAVDLLANRVDVLLGAGLRHWIPASSTSQGSEAHARVRKRIGQAFPFASRRQDERDLLEEASAAGYRVVSDSAGLESVKKAPVLGIFGNSAMPDALFEKELAARGQLGTPTLTDMTRKAVELLSEDPDGFFLMVEAGQIDWAGHNNDAGTMLHEMIRLDDALAWIFEWAEGRDDTLIVITADHETGSFGFSYSGRNLPKGQKLPGSAFRDREFKPNFNFGVPEVLDGIHAQKRSYYLIFEEYDMLPPEARKPEALMEIVNRHTAFPITLAEATDILRREPNRNYTPGHPSLSQATVPAVCDYPDFCPFGENSRMNLLARVVAKDQMVVWGTATHTATPVPVVAWGPPEATGPFGRLLHSTELRELIESAVWGDR